MSDRSRPSGQIAVGNVVIALLAYLPLVVTRRGQVVADTKQYLFIDPGGVLSGSTSLWDPGWALGTVSHQSVGYLWPMGPWFWLFDTLGVPMWLAQRLWLGTALAAAGLGVRFLGRRLGWSNAAGLVAALCYMLAPYPLAYASRLSTLILPWAALPWLVALGMLALRHRGWKYPLLIGLVGTTVGSVNASSLIYAGLAVIVWFVVAWLVEREVDTITMLLTSVRVGIALMSASLWWALALVVQGQYGADVLRFSESLGVVASGSPSTESLRGLGYWVFYGRDRTGPWVSAGEPYTQQVWLVGVSFAVAGIGVAALLLTRWRYRAYFLSLAAIGLVLTIGWHPYEAPATVAGWVRDDIESSAVALMLRSSPRALPMFLLATSVSIGVAIDALTAPAMRRVAIWSMAALAVLACVPLVSGRYVGDELARDESLPTAWIDAAAALDGGSSNERVILLPGGDFAAHRWGNTIDPILPGLIDRPMAARELIAFGPPTGADLLIALDRRAQERLLDPAAVAPVARLLGAGDVVVQNDLEYERYRTPRPGTFWPMLAAADGFDSIAEFGPDYRNIAGPDFPLIDEETLLTEPPGTPVPQVGVLAVDGALGVIRARPTAGAVVVSGSGETLVDLAEVGLLPPDRAVLYDGAITDEQLEAALADGASIVISDGNPKAGRRWKTVRDNVGMIEQVDGDGLTPDSADARLDLFGEQPANAQTVARQDGVRVTATSYGDPIAYAPEDRAVLAADGDLTTAWQTAAFTDARDESITFDWDAPVTTDSITVLQANQVDSNRFITDLDVIIDGGEPMRYQLDDTSHTGTGQTLTLPEATELTTLELRIWETTAGRRPGYGGTSGVGFTEVRLGDDIGAPPLTVETIVAASQLSERVAAADYQPPVTVTLRRARAVPVRHDPERLMRRDVELPYGATFEVGGVARLSSTAADSVLNDATNVSGALRAIATSRLPGSPAARAGAAIDGDPTTMWMPPIDQNSGAAIEVRFDEPIEIGDEPVTMVIPDDGIHSTPRDVRVITDAGERLVEVTPRSEGDGQAIIAIAPPPGPTGSVRFVIESVDPVITTEWYSATDVELPVGIAEIVIGDLGSTASGVDTGCRSDLLTIDGDPVELRLTPAPARSFNAQTAFDIAPCGEMNLDAGDHLIETTSGDITGIDIDLLTMTTGQPTTGTAPTPAVDVVEHGRGQAVVTVGPSESPAWLVLGESHSDGWEASIDGVSLGEPTVLDGFANGWAIPAADAPRTVEIEWVPNRTVRLGFWVSGLALVALAGLAFVSSNARRPDAAPDARLEPGEISMVTAVQAVSVGWPTIAASVVLVAAASRWWIGLIIGVAMVISRRRAGAVELLGLAAFALAALYVVVQVVRFRPPHDGAWTYLWERPHLIGWVTVGVIIASAVTASVERRRCARGSPRDTPRRR